MPEKIPRGVILDLLDLYDLKIQIVYAFLEEEPSISPKLNSYSIEVTEEIYAIAAKWQIEFEGCSPIKEKNENLIPFHFDGDLIMEIAFRSQGIGFNFSGLYPGPGFDWDGLREDEIKREMHATYRLIKNLPRSDRVNEDVVERDDYAQDLVIDTKSALHEFKATRVSVTKLASEPVAKMEAAKIPEITPHDAGDNVIYKGKNRVYPPKFPSTAWPNATIHFINEHDVFITAGAKSAQSNYKALGFEDTKRDAPNRAWQFLLGLAHNDGATIVLDTPIPDNTKQMKKQLSDGLMKLFDNATDPFHNPATTSDHVYRIKLNLIPPEEKHPRQITEEYGAEEPDPEEDEEWPVISL